MIYILVFIGLFFLELLYFKVANYFNIIDKPNERSSHSSITLRGGGIIFYFGALIYFIYSGFQYPWFFSWFNPNVIDFLFG
jgi:UDP-N-acetylmuramyl pentapeptide phosphotransferase/UDP-N-acetylglucosamine-1-phosphate transferase